MLNPFVIILIYRWENEDLKKLSVGGWKNLNLSPMLNFVETHSNEGYRNILNFKDEAVVM